MKKKRSDSSKCSVESVGLDSDSKEQMILEDFYKARKPRKSKLAPALRSGRQGLKVAPCIRAEHHNTDDVHFVESGLQQSRGFETRKDKISHAIKGAGGGSSKNFVASGPMTTINTHAKSTGKGLEKENSLKEISEKSPQARYLNMTYLRRDFPVKLFPLRENAKVLRTKQGELFSTKYAELLEVKELATYSLRMLKDYFLTTADERSQSYSFHWMNLGTMWNGKCLTLSIGCPKTVKGFLSSVLEEKVDEKYYLSEKWLNYMERHCKSKWPKDKIADCIDANEYRGPSKQRANVVDLRRSRQEGKPRIYEDLSPALNRTDYKEPRCVMEEESDLKQVGNIDEKGHNSLWGRVYSPEGLATNINAEGGGLGAKTGLYAIFQRPRGKNKGSIKEKMSPSITTSDFERNNLLIANTVDRDGYLRRGTRDRDKDGKAVLTSIPKRRIRRLTPRECERLQGFPDDWTRVPAIGNDAGIQLGCYEAGEEDEIIKGKIMSDTQRYKMMGNAISVPVITAIGEAILKTIK